MAAPASAVIGSEVSLRGGQPGRSVAELAVGAAEAVVRRNLDHETQVALVERYIAEVGSQAR